MPKKKRKVGDKVLYKKFATELVKNGGNQTQAALATGRYKNYTTANGSAQRLIKKPEVQAEIINAMQDSGIDFKYVMDTRKQFIEEGKKHLYHSPKDKRDKITSSDVSKHLSGLEKIMLTLGEGNHSNNSGALHQHLHLENGSMKELLDKRKELNSWFTGILEGETVE